jgi:glycerophosphoryl diester phosphodiesterase
MTALIVGHRGAANVKPENTLSSFRAGVEAGADLLECDVHLSADDQLVIMHDASIDRTAAEESPLRTGQIADLTREQLDTVVLPEGESVPSLDQVLEVASTGSTPIYVEVKAEAAAEGAEALDSSPAWIISFKADALRAARRTAPHIPISYIAHESDEEFWATAKELGAEAVSLRHQHIDEEIVRRADEEGVLLNAWTLNEEEPLQRMLDLGVDTITTDDPAWARTVVEAHARS